MNHPTQTVPLKDPFVAALLAWFVPGLGHIYQGRFSKGVLFFVCLGGLFFWGMHLGEWKVVYWAWDERKPFVEGICRLGMGIASVPAFLQSLSKDESGFPLLGRFELAPTNAELQELNARLNRMWDIAKVYTMVAALLNVLVVLDAYAGPAEQDGEASEPSEEGAVRA